MMTGNSIAEKFTTKFPIFKAGFQRVDEWVGRIVKAIRNIPPQMQANQHVAIGVIATANTLFFLIINSVANRLDRGCFDNQNQPSLTKRIFKVIVLNGALVGGSTLGMNLLLSKLTKYPLNRTILAAITVSAVIFRTAFGTASQKNKKDEQPVVAAPSSAPKENPKVEERPSVSATPLVSKENTKPIEQPSTSATLLASIKRSTLLASKIKTMVEERPSLRATPLISKEKTEPEARPSARATPRVLKEKNISEDRPLKKNEIAKAEEQPLASSPPPPSAIKKDFSKEVKSLVLIRKLAKKVLLKRKAQKQPDVISMTPQIKKPLNVIPMTPQGQKQLDHVVFPIQKQLADVLMTPQVKTQSEDVPEAPPFPLTTEKRKLEEKKFDNEPQEPNIQLAQLNKQNLAENQSQLKEIETYLGALKKVIQSIQKDLDQVEELRQEIEEMNTEIIQSEKDLKKKEEMLALLKEEEPVSYLQLQVKQGVVMPIPFYSLERFNDINTKLGIVELAPLPGKFLKPAQILILKRQQEKLKEEIAASKTLTAGRQSTINTTFLPKINNGILFNEFHDVLQLKKKKFAYWGSIATRLRQQIKNDETLVSPIPTGKTNQEVGKTNKETMASFIQKHPELELDMWQDLTRDQFAAILVKGDKYQDKLGS